MGTWSPSDSCYGRKLSAARGLVLFFVLCTCDHSQRTSAGCSHLCAKKSLLLQKIYSNHCVKVCQSYIYPISHYWPSYVQCKLSFLNPMKMSIYMQQIMNSSNPGFFYGSSHSIAHFGGLNSIEAPLMLSLAHSKVALVLGGFEEATDTLRRTWGLWGWPGYMVFKCV